MAIGTEVLVSRYETRNPESSAYLSCRYKTNDGKSVELKAPLTSEKSTMQATPNCKIEFCETLSQETKCSSVSSLSDAQISGLKRTEENACNGSPRDWFFVGIVGTIIIGAFAYGLKIIRAGSRAAKLVRNEPT